MENNEQKISIEVIKEAITNNKDLESQLVATVLQTETGKTVLNNHLKNNNPSDEAIKEATKKAYGHIDEALTGLGYEKPQGLKTSEWATNIVKDLKSKVEASGKSKNDVEEYKNMIEAIKTQSATKEQELMKALENEKNTNRFNSIKGVLRSSSLEFDPKIPSVAVDAVRKEIESKLIANAKKDGDKIVFYKEDGKPYLNDLLEPASAEEVQKLLYSDILKKKTPGGGAGKEGNPPTELKDGNIVLNKTKVNSRVGMMTQFNEACKSQGILKGSEEYLKQWKQVMATDEYKALPER
jgi:glutamate synthase domain-containing protein 2